MDDYEDDLDSFVDDAYVETDWSTETDELDVDILENWEDEDDLEDSDND